MRRWTHLRNRPWPRTHDVQIELDDPSGRFSPGATLSGRVVAHAKAAEQCESLSVQIQLHARGKVESVLVLAEQPLFSGAWTAGEQAVYPFALTVPRCPAPYPGHLFHIAPRLVAVLVPHRTEAEPTLADRLAGGRDSQASLVARAYPEAVAPISIEPDPRPLVIQAPTSGFERTSARRGVRLAVGAVLFTIGCALTGLAALIALPDDFLNAGSIIMAAFGVPLFVMGALVVRAHLGAWMAERKVGVPVVRAHHRAGQNGGALDVSVQLPSTASVRGGTATLRVSEEAVVEVPTLESEKGIRTEERVLAELSADLGGGTEPATLQQAIGLAQLPALPQRQTLPSASIRWDLHVTVQLPWWPDWTSAVRLDVFPGGEQRSIGEQASLTFEPLRG